MRDSEGTIARPADSVRCENPKCCESILLDESLFSPDVDTPQEHIHTRYDPKVAASQPSVDIITIHGEHFKRRSESDLLNEHTPKSVVGLSDELIRLAARAEPRKALHVS